MPTQDSEEGDLAYGLTSDESRALLAKYGSNAMPDTAIQPWRMALAKFWAPVPCFRIRGIATFSAEVSRGNRW
jgi:hypothetical protein